MKSVCAPVSGLAVSSEMINAEPGLINSLIRAFTSSVNSTRSSALAADGEGGNDPLASLVPFAPRLGRRGSSGVSSVIVVTCHFNSVSLASVYDIAV